MNALLNRAQFWFRELGITTEERVDFPEPGRSCLAISRDGIDDLCGIGVVYETVINELRGAMGTNKFSLISKDREWIYIDTF
jgi:hypothetical protein